MLVAYNKLRMAFGFAGSAWCMATNRHAAALHAQSGLFLRASWCSTASRCPFFWLSNVTVTKSAVKRSVGVESGESRSMRPDGRFRQNCRSFHLIWVVHVLQLPDGVYSPTRSKKKKVVPPNPLGPGLFQDPSSSAFLFNTVRQRLQAIRVAIWWAGSGGLSRCLRLQEQRRHRCRLDPARIQQIQRHVWGGMPMKEH